MTARQPETADSQVVRSVSPYADQCQEYEFLGGFLDRDIYNNGEPFLLTETERCVLYIALKACAKSKSMVIHDPFPSSKIPLAFCSTQTFSNNPQIGADGAPTLAFPATGYTSRFWKFHYSRQLNPPTSREQNDIYPVYTVYSLSDMNDGWGLYYVPSNRGDFEFDFESDYQAPSTVFVDLRRPTWEEYQFNYIEELRENHPEASFIFYTKRMSKAATRITERLGITPLSITNQLLSTATPSPSPEEGESELAVQERIINSEPSFTVNSIHDERLSDTFGDLYEMKDRLRERRCAYPLVSAAYNSLVKLPVKPAYWAHIVETNPNRHFNSTGELFKKIRDAAEKQPTSDADLLYGYADTINGIRRKLDERHPVQNAVLRRIHDAAVNGTNERFVVSNTPQREALEYALNEEDYAGADAGLILDKGDEVPRSMETTYVYLYPPYKTSSIYEFPPSPNIEFMVFSVWKNVLSHSATDATKDIPSQSTTNHYGGGDGEDDFVLDLTALDDSDINEYLNSTGLKGRSTSESSTASTSDERIRFTLADSGDTVEFAPNALVPTYDREHTTVRQKRAKSVRTGESLIRLPSISENLYDALITDAYELEAVKESHQLVEDWREMLTDGREEDDTSWKGLRRAFEMIGSDIKTTQTIKYWCNGNTIGPQDPDDVRRAIELFRSDWPNEFIERHWENVWDAIKHIRYTHAEMGRNIRRYVHAEMNSTSDVSMKGVGDENMLRTITRDIDIETIEEVSRET